MAAARKPTGSGASFRRFGAPFLPRAGISP